jgi:hypothetical protein
MAAIGHEVWVAEEDSVHPRRREVSESGPAFPKRTGWSLHRAVSHESIVRVAGGGTWMGRKLNYAGIGGAVAGVISLLGIYSYWWSTDTTSYDGVADISGRLALAMSVGLFAFGVAFVVMSDPSIRRAMGASMTICAVVLTLACVWGVLRADDVAPGATIELGLWVSVIGGVLGIAASLLALRDAMRAVAGSSPTTTGV